MKEMLAPNSNADYIEIGEAIDQETIIDLRKEIESFVQENYGPFMNKTKLFWQLNDKGTFDFEIHFFKEKDADTSSENQASS
jgi:hypothetical protein